MNPPSKPATLHRFTLPNPTQLPSPSPSVWRHLIPLCLFLSTTLHADEIFRTILRRQGDQGVHTYRIPGLATTPRGTLIAVFDIRHKSSGDLPGDIDVGTMRSTDHGTTWSAMRRIIDLDATQPNSLGNGVGDPAILVDTHTGTLFVAALWSKGNRGWTGSAHGLSPEETGQFLITKSIDDGLTWSKPINITPQVKHPDWRLCFQGPGNGIQLRNGTLLFPAQYKDPNKIPHSCFIASTDHGVTWKISPPAIPTHPPTSESAIAELTDGTLLLSMRDESRSGQRAWARWESKGDLWKGKWTPHWMALPDPTCMANLLQHPHGPLLFSNLNHPKHRVALTLRTSTNNGVTWSDGKLLDPRPSGYSSMTILKDGRVGILYETGEKTGIETLTFARLPLNWIQ